MAKTSSNKTENELSSKVQAAAQKQTEHYENCRDCYDAVMNSEKDSHGGKSGYMVSPSCRQGLKLHRAWQKALDDYLRFKQRVSIN